MTSINGKGKNKKAQLAAEQLNVGQIVSGMDLEEFQNVLDQVVNHNLPESQKSPLVQRLNQQVAEEQENSLDSCLRSCSVLDDKTSKSTGSGKKNVRNSLSPSDTNLSENAVSDRLTNHNDGTVNHSSPPLSHKKSSFENGLSNGIDKKNGGPKLDCQGRLSKPNSTVTSSLIKNQNAPSTESSQTTTENSVSMPADDQLPPSSLQDLQQFCDTFMSRNLTPSTVTNTSHSSAAVASNSSSQLNGNTRFETLGLQTSSFNGTVCPLEIEMSDLGRKPQIMEFSSQKPVTSASGTCSGMSKSTGLTSSLSSSVRQPYTGVDTFIDLSCALLSGSESSAGRSGASQAELANVASTNTVYSNSTRSAIATTSESRSSLVTSRPSTVSKAGGSVTAAAGTSTSLSTVDSFLNPLAINTALIEENGQYYLFVDNKNNTYPMNSAYGKKNPQTGRTDALGKKRKKVEKATLAEEIEGYVGDRDLEYLTNYVTGNICNDKESSKEASTGQQQSKEGRRKRNKQAATNTTNTITTTTCTVAPGSNPQHTTSSSSNSTGANTTPNGELDIETACDHKFGLGGISSQQTSSTGRNKSNKQGNAKNSNVKARAERSGSTGDRPVSDAPIGESGRIPTNLDGGDRYEELSLYEVEELLCIASDSEVPADPDSGFQTVRYKQLRRKKKSAVSSDKSLDNKHHLSDRTLVEARATFTTRQSSTNQAVERRSSLLHASTAFGNVNNSSGSTGESNTTIITTTTTTTAIIIVADQPIDSTDDYPELERSATTARGYESELDYCADEFRRRKHHRQQRREQFEIHSDEESPTKSSDQSASTGESTEGPISSSLSRISYAAIARKRYEKPLNEHPLPDSTTGGACNSDSSSAVLFEDTVAADTKTLPDCDPSCTRKPITGEQAERKAPVNKQQPPKLGENSSKPLKKPAIIMPDSSTKDLLSSTTATTTNTSPTTDPSSAVISTNELKLSTDNSNTKQTTKNVSRQMTNGNKQTSASEVEMPLNATNSFLPAVIMFGDQPNDSLESNSSNRNSSGNAGSGSSFTFGFFDEPTKEMVAQDLNPDGIEPVEFVQASTSQMFPDTPNAEAKEAYDSGDELRGSPLVEQLEAELHVLPRANAGNNTTSRSEQPEWRRQMQHGGGNHTNNHMHGLRFNQARSDVAATAAVKQILFGNAPKLDDDPKQPPSHHTISTHASSRADNSVDRKFKNSNQSDVNRNHLNILNYIRRSWDEVNRNCNTTESGGQIISQPIYFQASK